MRFPLPGRNRSVRSVIVESKKTKCFSSGMKFLLLLFVLFSAQSSFGQITNNYIDYTNGLHGTVCVTQPESNPGPTPYAVFNAPAGTVFTTVNFASYGTPGGSCSSSFSINASCNATTSQSVVEGYLLGNNSASISPSNGEFTDPCINTVKKLSILATYTQPICSGSSPGKITGSTPGGPLFPSYSWEKSTTGSSSGFNPIPGETSINYNTPGNLTQTTWFRRKVTAFLYADSYSPVLQITVSPSPSAIISYSGSPFCINSGTASVTRTGTSGGTYSSTSGLSINSTTGAINLNSSTAGTYTVTYTIAASGGCSIYTTTTSITVNPSVGTPVFALGSTSTRCQGTGSVTYTATATNAGVITYSLDAASISGGNSINSSTGAVSYSAGWNGTSTITASASGCGGPATSTHTVTTGTIPSVSATTTYTCVGGSSGTIIASGSGGSTPYTYSLNGGSYQSSNLFTGLAAGTYTLSIKSNTGCTVSVPASITVSPYPNSTDDQTATASNSWIGHIYNGMNFQQLYRAFHRSRNF